MKITNSSLARLVRDAGIEAMDALNAILAEAAPHLSTEEEERELRRAIAMAMSAILDNLVNPALRDYPELDVSDDQWGEIARNLARNRLASRA